MTKNVDNKKNKINIVNYSHQQTSIGNIMERAADTQWGSSIFFESHSRFRKANLFQEETFYHNNRHVY